MTGRGINPEEHLKDVLGRLPHIKAGEEWEITPAKWLAARTPASRTAQLVSVKAVKVQPLT